MRLHKQSTSKKSEYKIYPDLAARNADIKNIEDGQEIKVLDASGDNNIKSGWAIYKYSLKSEKFDLLEKEEQPVIPKPISLSPHVFAPTISDNYTDLESAHTFLGGMKIMQDFDISFTINELLYIKINGGDYVEVPVKLANGEIKYLNVTGSSIWSSSFRNTNYGQTVYVHLSAMLLDKPLNAKYNAGYKVSENSKCVDLYPMKGLSYRYATIQTVKPYKNNWDPDKIKIYKHWKKALAPAEERIVIPEKTYSLDNVTLFETYLSEKQTIFAPALLQTHPANFFILEDFDFEFSTGKFYGGDIVYLEVNPLGGSKHIPVRIEGTVKYMSIVKEYVRMHDVFGSDYGGNWKYFTLTASIDDTKDNLQNMGTEYENNGSAMYMSLHAGYLDYKLCQIAVKFEKDGTSLDPKNVKVFKYWKQALAPLEERLKHLGLIS